MWRTDGVGERYLIGDRNGSYCRELSTPLTSMD